MLQQNLDSPAFYSSFRLLPLGTTLYMETVIKVNPSELNAKLLHKIKKFIGKKENIDVTISLKEFDPDYVDALDRSIEQAQSGDVLSFTMEEFAAYTPKKK